MMSSVAHDASLFVPPAEVEEVELYHPKTFVGKYIWSQDAKIIAIQYAITAIGIGLVALVLSWLMRLQLGFPNSFAFIDPSSYLQFVTMHGMIMVIYLLTALFLGGFGNYLIPLMVGARDMVFPYVNMVSYWVYLFAVLLLVASFFVTGGPTGAGWTLYPPQAISRGTPGASWGIILMLVSLAFFIIGFTMGGLNYVVTVLQARTRGMTMMRLPLTVWGIFMATVLALLAFPALFVSAIMMILDLTLGTSFFMPALVSVGEQSGHSGGNPLLFQHLFWFFGDPGHRRVELRGVGAPHVRQRHEPVFRLLFRHHYPDHRRSHGHQGLQLGADAVARQHPPHRPDALCHRVHLHVHQRRPDGLVPRQRDRERPALGHHVRGRALPYGDGDCAHHGRVRGDLPLVPQDHRADAERYPGQISLLGQLRRELWNLLSHALPRHDGRAAQVLCNWRYGLHPRIGPLRERVDHHRGVDRGRRPIGVSVQPRLELFQRQAVG